MPKDDQYPRLQHIDSLLYWQKPFSNRCLQQHLEVSRSTASRDLDEFAQQYPYNKPEPFTNELVNQDARSQYLVPPMSYRPQLAEKQFERFIVHYAKSKEYYSTGPHIGRRVQPAIAGKLLFAIEQKQRFESQYLSMSSGDTEQRVIQPHALVNICGRFHVRAWCEKSKRFSDFVLARFNDYAELLGSADQKYSHQYDEDWNTALTLVVVPDPRLNPQRRQAISIEYDMQNNQLAVPTTAALLNYVIKELRVDRYQENPLAQQIIIEPACREQLLPYLWR